VFNRTGGCSTEQAGARAAIKVGIRASRIANQRKFVATGFLIEVFFGNT